MTSSLINLLLAFIEGFALILSPCILPILPIVLAGSLTGSKKRPIGIIIGFTLTFAVFSYFAHALVNYSGIDLNLVRHAAYVILVLLAIIMLSQRLSELFSRLTQVIASYAHKTNSTEKKQEGLFGGIILGAVISLIWTPCAGPILASVIVQIAIQKETAMSFFTLLAFAIGAGIPMLLIAFYSLKLRDTFGFLKNHAQILRKVLALIILLNVAYMLYQESSYNRTSTEITQSGIKTANYLQDGLWHYYQAPAVAGIDAWINSPPLTLDTLKGKVVLIDFWTYSCINCIRTLPYINYWYKTYHDKGLVIIGVHTPEFDFESKLTNVEQAVKSDGILYPVALDNHFVTWNNYENHYWPAHYLINKQGKVVYVHYGEGDYDITENNIRFLLGEDYSDNTKQFDSQQFSLFTTPETYLGYARADSNANQSVVRDQTASYQFPTQLNKNAWALSGQWQVNPDRIVAMQAGASSQLRFTARKVYMVMGPSGAESVTVKIMLNGKPLLSNQGNDVVNGEITVDKHSIYQVINLGEAETGLLEIQADSPGLELYTFTFGN
jgi:cytochrome c biogenesis protein CcdA